MAPEDARMVFEDLRDLREEVREGFRALDDKLTNHMRDEEQDFREIRGDIKSISASLAETDKATEVNRVKLGGVMAGISAATALAVSKISTWF